MKARDFEIFSHAMRPRLLQTARAIVGSDMVAEDIVQDAMLKLWSLAEDLDKCRSAQAFAIVVTRRLAINELRRSRPGVIVSLNDEDAAIPSAEEELIERQRTEHVDAVLASLPEASRTLLTLRHIEGYDNASIAALLGSSEGAVRTALSRARRRLAQVFIDSHSSLS